MYPKHDVGRFGNSVFDRLERTQFVIFGCGALGSNLAVSLARLGASNFVLVDDDEVDGENYQNQAYYLEHVYTSKVFALELILADIQPSSRIKKIRSRIVTKRDAEIASKRLSADIDEIIIIDSFDNVESRRLISGDNVLHVGMGLDVSDVKWGNVYTIPDKDPEFDACDAPYTLPQILVTVGEALFTIISRLNDVYVNKIIVMDEHGVNGVFNVG